MSLNASASNASADSGRYLLWVDGVGGYVLCLANEITIGGPASGNSSAEIALMANLSRRHATIARSGESYVLHPHAATCIGNRQIDEATPLTNGYELQFGQSVRLKFRLPTVLSGTAVLEFVSDHRPVYSVDGAIMMEDNCLFGVGPDNHIVCPLASESFVLFRRDGQIWCKCRTGAVIDGKLNNDGGPIQPGHVVTVADVRFRLEEMPNPA